VRIPRFAKVLVAFMAGLMLVQLLHACSSSSAAEKTRLTIATVNNGDMVVMQELSRQFEQENPNIELRLPLVAPSVVVLLLWMIVPLAMTLWFSFQRYNLLNPDARRFIGIENFTFILTDPGLWTAIGITLILVASVLAITIALGTLLAVLFDQDFPGRGIARVLAISPFFVMPTVSALIWGLTAVIAFCGSSGRSLT